MRNKHDLVRERKAKRRMIIIGLFLAALMISSIIGFSGSDSNSENEEEYNGHYFYRANGGWATRLNGEQVVFGSAPSNLVNIESEDFLITTDKVYVLFDPTERDSTDYAVQRISAFIRYLGKSPVASCTQEKGCEDIPIVDCDNDFDVVYLKNGDDKLFMDRNCVVLEGNDGKIVDLFSYKLLGIM